MARITKKNNNKMKMINQGPFPFKKPSEGGPIKPPPDHPDAFKYPSVPGGEQRSGPMFYKKPQKGV